jgi:selenobiotic family peptide radical SAM maturase
VAAAAAVVVAAAGAGAEVLRARALGGRRAASFTLQWHLTSACGMRCTHCYDGGPRPALPLARAHAIVDDLVAFCRHSGVAGQICFTGGDPLLSPHFLELWSAAARAGLDVAILGNPAPRDRVEAIVAVRRPRVWQVSVEGFEATHDAVRGPGSFGRTVAFLGLLRELGVRAHVMLTLTAANVDEAVPLARALRGRYDRFAFSRLARSGRGAALDGVSRAAWSGFATRWADAAAHDHRLALKDGLLGLAQRAAGRPPAGGCTGAGCGAAFNFLAVLPDGEVHACRKLPSPVGHLAEASLAAIWSSPAAARWRKGSTACAGCRLRPTCGGCPAVTHGEGLDPLEDRDPLCPGRVR